MAESEHGLITFAAEQKTFQIGDVSVGGQPGIRPVVLIGSLFYHGHDVSIDEERGVFDSEAAERLIRCQEDYARRTGNHGMLDVVGATPEAIERHLEFAASVTDMPLLVDGTTSDVRLAGLEYVARSGISNRAVYNSIQPGIEDEELQAIRRCGVKAAVLLTYTLGDFTAMGRAKCVEALVPRLEDAGIEKLMVDTCVLDMATMGSACAALRDIKNQTGLPVGAGVHNAVAVWKGLKTKMGDHARKPAVAAACAAAAAIGADFVLYGPIEDAKVVFPAVAMIDTAHSQVMMESGNRPPDDHPRYRIG